MKSIPKDFINELLAKVDIVDVIGLRLKLKKNGSNYSSTCPFHSEKTPSFTVSPSKQFYHCFGCGAHGNVISFLMQYENLEFKDAIENLANYVGMEIPQAKTENTSLNFNELHSLLQAINKLYQKELKRSKEAINYLKQRGLTGEICKYFNIGYATNDWDNLITISKNNSKIKQELLTAGMLIHKENSNRYYSRFRHRIMIPIKDKRGNVIAFGGRSLDNSLPKYLNSPETPIFHKRNELFGLYEVKKQNKKVEQIIVVEGYLDVISLFQYGITNAVASLGTAITTNQIQYLLKNTTNIMFCFDGDLAGKHAAARAMENILPLMREGIQATFLFLPQNEDPDSLIRKIGSDEFKKLTKNALTLSEFFLQGMAANRNFKNIEEQALAANMAKEYLQKMPNGIYKQLLLTKLSDLLQVDISNIATLNNQSKTHTKTNIFTSKEKSKNPVLMAINLLLLNPDLAQLVDNKEKFEGSQLPYINLLNQLINLSKSQHNLTVGAILEYYRDSADLELLNKLLQYEPILAPKDLKNEFLDVIQLIFKSDEEQIKQKLLQKAATMGLNSEEKLQLQRLIAKTKT